MNLLAVLALCAVPLARPPVQAPSRDEPAAQATAEALAMLRAAQATRPADVTGLPERLAAGGAHVVPVLFAVYDLGILPPEGADGRTVQLDPDVRAAVGGAFASLPAPALRAHAARIAAANHSARTRATAVRILGGVGSPGDLVLIAKLATPPSGEAPGDAMRATFARALALVFEREPGDVRAIQSLFDAVHPSLRTDILTTIARGVSQDRIGVLAALLGRVPAQDVRILREITDLAATGRGAADEFVKGSVRALLDSADGDVVRAAAVACGALVDDDAVPDLIEVLAGNREPLASTARRALTSIVGYDAGADHRYWRTWYDDEMRWWREDSRDALTGLRSSDRAIVVAAITEITHRRLYRYELASALVGVLDRPEPLLRRLACVALGTLGVSHVRLEVLPLVEDPHAEVREAARATLARLSSRVVPRD